MSQTLFEKLEFADEKNLLIQGLPSSIEKQFCKLSFAKNMTPLLKSRKIDFALVFAVNENQLEWHFKGRYAGFKRRFQILGGLSENYLQNRYRSEPRQQLAAVDLCRL